ncbi:helix-turn-helix domain-containing protein [Desulfurivibrio dismutans]|uniref:helix-turn-helix domain-containing protein n=1 Tax=Desulfurivibrio dismutans TaxID=1398908 RepID=UPI0023DBEA0F|nr:helix-turn-helix domain-containing protein [Desulfurivibrio alkaliphilus]MDF1613660.1 helix-turn-helix domain-containing protein [Desulfurivibrio alkaliphilus]
MSQNQSAPTNGGNHGQGQNNKRQNNYSGAAAQRQAMLNHLASHSLTTIYSRDHLGVLHPGGRVCELRKMGYKILTHWVWEPGASGKMHRVAKYTLERE